MSRLRAFLSRVSGWLGDRKRDAELRAEIDAHIAEAVEEFERQGVPVDEARRLALTAIGLAMGLAGADLLAPVIDRLLVRMPATDPVTFAGTILLLTTTTLMACYLPARRATRVDPMLTLRSE